MRFKSGSIKLAGGTFVLAASLLACNDNNFKSDGASRVVRKANPAAPESYNADPKPKEDLPKKDQEIEVSRLPDSVSQIFSSSVEKDATFPFSLDTKGSESQFTLADINSSLVDNRSQVSRTPGSDSAKQGAPGSSENDQLPQNAVRGIVDILVVVDDSGSMAEEQDNLAGKMEPLLSSLIDTDWQIGVITTSPPAVNAAGQDICVLRDLIKSTDGPADSSAQKTKFANAVLAGTRGSGSEQGIRAAANGLRCARAPWVRSNSSVAVLILSDEDNCSTDSTVSEANGGCPSGTAAAARNISFVTNVVENELRREIGKTAGFYGLFAQPGVSCPTAASVGNVYQSLINFKNTAGKNVAGSICDGDYTNTLTKISQNIADLLEAKFLLEKTPDAGSLVLKVRENNGTIKTQVQGIDFTLVNNAITFLAGRAPAAKSTIIADYRVGERPIVKTLALSKAPAPDTLKVTVDGVETSDFTLSGSTVVFRNAPPQNSTMAASYRQNDKALLSRFAVDKAPIGNAVSVSVNGQSVSNFQYDASKKEVVFAQAPADNASIAISYDFRVGPQLKYNLPVAADATDIKMLDGAREVAFTRNGNEFTIGSGDFVSGKTLKLNFDLPDGTDRIFSLPQDPIAGSESLDAAGSCGLDSGIILNNGSLTASCPVEVKTDFVLKYKYIDLATSYTVAGIENPEVGQFKVFVNGKETSDYVRTGSTIVLNSDPGLDAQVAVQYTLPE